MARDIHKDLPKHAMHINRVGVSGLNFPLLLKRKEGGNDKVPAIFDMYSSLLKEHKGTHMSRFSEVLMEYVSKPLSGNNFRALLEHLQDRLNAEDVYVSAKFPYFMEKFSPATQKKMLMSYDCRFVGIVFKSQYSFFEEIKVPITSVCPCSKNMSAAENLTSIDLSKIFPKDVVLDADYFNKALKNFSHSIGMGAHNQRGVITLQVRCNPNTVWLEDLIQIAESSGSCEVYSLLKRPDEKFVTEKAYNNPKFVEDIAREVTSKAMKRSDISWLRVKVENFESIHDHSATCYIERIKKGNAWRRSNRGSV